MLSQVSADETRTLLDLQSLCRDILAVAPFLQPPLVGFVVFNAS